MAGAKSIIALLLFGGISLSAQTAEGDYKLALPDHKGQLSWQVPGFKIVETSAKPNDREIGLRGENGASAITFLGFLFLVPEDAPLTSAKCLNGAIEPMKKANSAIKMTGSLAIPHAGGIPVSLVSYEGRNKKGPLYSVRGFVANADVCGDLEFYSEKPIALDDAMLKAAFGSLRLDPNYQAKWDDVFLYAEALFRHKAYNASGPMFEAALAKLNIEAPSDKKMRRILTDQSGMSYGISGSTSKARALFEKAITDDPDYPLNYYNLACADAGEKNLAAAKRHLQEAFARKANVIPGEKMPDPAQDDSFTPYRNDKEFWKFIESLK